MDLETRDTVEIPNRKRTIEKMIRSRGLTPGYRVLAAGVRTQSSRKRHAHVYSRPHKDGIGAVVNFQCYAWVMDNLDTGALIGDALPKPFETSIKYAKDVTKIPILADFSFLLFVRNNLPRQFKADLRVRSRSTWRLKRRG